MVPLPLAALLIVPCAAGTRAGVGPIGRVARSLSPSLRRLPPCPARSSPRAQPSAESYRAYLVGVGPGDPELLTLRAYRLLAMADLVLYDRLIPSDILRCARPGATLLYCGKAQGLHSRSQEEIHMLLWHYARRGKVVVRLKGGDPTVFGRGGEELQYLEDRGVDVEVVPGITAACGVAASLGMPLTHRDHADSLQFVTGHKQAPVVGEEGGLRLDFERCGVGKWSCATVDGHSPPSSPPPRPSTPQAVPAADDAGGLYGAADAAAPGQGARGAWAAANNTRLRRAGGHHCAATRGPR